MDPVRFLHEEAESLRGDGCPITAKRCDDAADEIERLRRQLFTQKDEIRNKLREVACCPPGVDLEHWLGMLVRCLEDSVQLQARVAELERGPQAHDVDEFYEEPGS